MRVVLMHNPSAGEEDHSARDLIEQIRRAGHEVVGDASRRKELAAALETPCDLVAVAGGDGTVGKAAEVLARTGIPFTILPLGTANNIARHLGLTGDIAALIDQWHRSVQRGFDRAVVRRGHEETLPFIEALGFGVFPQVIRKGEKLAGQDSPRDEKLDRALDLFQEALARAETSRYVVWADGQDLSGDYLLVEAMNIDALGAHVPIAPASSADGKLDLVLVTAAERDALARHLEDLREGRTSGLRLASRQVSRVVIASADAPHRDGRILAGSPARNHFEVVVEPHALQVLAPE